VAPGSKPVPLICTRVVPMTGPAVGEIAVTDTVEGIVGEVGLDDLSSQPEVTTSARRLAIAERGENRPITVNFAM
jgi:hypothetical protein